jgi:hypothetical protein
MAGSTPSCRSSSLHQLIPWDSTITEPNLCSSSADQIVIPRRPTGGLLGVALLEGLDERLRSLHHGHCALEAMQKCINLNRTFLLDLSPIRDGIPFLDFMKHAPILIVRAL